MKALTYIRATVGLLLILASGRAGRADVARHQLSSADELNRAYVVWLSAEAKNGIVGFFGKRKDSNPGSPTEYGLYLFDRNSLRVWPLRSESIDKCFPSRGYGLHELAFDSSGTKIAAVPTFYPPDGKGPYFNIVVIDPVTLNAEAVVADEQVNHSPSFSPDGRHLAFRSTERWPQASPDPSIRIKENAVRVVDLSTKQITTVMEPYVIADREPILPLGRTSGGGPPTWLDNDRLLFITFATDPDFIAKHIGGFVGREFAYRAVANIRTGEIKRLFLRVWHGGSAVDRDRKRIYFCDEKRIIETDFDLNILRQVLEAPAGKRIEITGVENGEVRYRIY